MEKQLNVFIVDDHTLVRDAFAYYLENIAQISISGQAGTEAESLAKVAAAQPDVVLIAINAPIIDALEATAWLKAQNEDLKLVALSIHPEELCLIPFIEAGGLGYVKTTASGADLLKALRQADAGDAFLSPEGVRVMVRRYHPAVEPDKSQNTAEVLSEREKQVLIGIIHGFNMRQIGEKLLLSKSTIETYKRRIFEKLNLHNKADLVAYAIKNKLYRE